MSKSARTATPAYHTRPTTRVCRPISMMMPDNHPTSNLRNYRFKSLTPREVRQTHDLVYDTNLKIRTNGPKFSGDFECGNLGQVYKIGPRAYEIKMLPDPTNYYSALWFFFKVENLKPGEYFFVINGFFRDCHQHNIGVQPTAYSEHLAKRGIGWQRIGTNLNFWTFKHSIVPEYALSFNFTVLHADTMYFSFLYPYTFTDLNNYLLDSCTTNFLKPKVAPPSNISDHTPNSISNNTCSNSSNVHNSNLSGCNYNRKKACLSERDNAIINNLVMGRDVSTPRNGSICYRNANNNNFNNLNQNNVQRNNKSVNSNNNNNNVQRAFSKNQVATNSNKSNFPVINHHNLIINQNSNNSNINLTNNSNINNNNINNMNHNLGHVCITNSQQKISHSSCYNNNNLNKNNFLQDSPKKRVPQNDWFKFSILCKSPGGLDVPAIYWDADEQCCFDVNNIPRKRGKPLVVIAARLHPGESNSSYAMEGFMDFVQSNTNESKQLLTNYSLLLLPMINPDGVVCGFYRPALNGEDVNRVWKNPNEVQQSVAFNVIRILDQVTRFKPIAFLLDFHGHTAQSNCFTYGVHNPAVRMNEYERLFPKTMAKVCSLFDERNSLSMNAREFPTTMRVALHHRYQIPFAYTLEMSFGAIEIGPESSTQMTPHHYRHIGEMTGLAITKMFSSCSGPMILGRNILPPLLKSDNE